MHIDWQPGIFIFLTFNLARTYYVFHSLQRDESLKYLYFIYWLHVCYHGLAQCIVGKRVLIIKNRNCHHNFYFLNNFLKHKKWKDVKIDVYSLFRGRLLWFMWHWPLKLFVLQEQYTVYSKSATLFLQIQYMLKISWKL